MSLVDVLNVTKEFESGEETIRPLDGVSLSIEKGDYASLMGASGSGQEYVAESHRRNRPGDLWRNTRSRYRDH